MAKKPNGSLELALTFDDVLLKPGLSDVLPSEVDIRTRITRDIPLNIPIIASSLLRRGSDGTAAIYLGTHARCAMFLNGDPG